MKVIIGNKSTTFNVKVVGELNLKEFEKLCLDQSTFKQLPKKERTKKIKEIHGNIKGIFKTVKGAESSEDLATDN